MTYRSSARSGVVLVVAGVATLAGTALFVGQRAGADAAAQRQTTAISRAVDESVNALKAELIQEIEAVSDIPQFRSALANRADAATFLDLFKNEDWWDRYRSRACAILVEGEVLVTQNFDPSVAVAGARAARSAAGVSVQALDSQRQVSLVAVGAYRLPRIGITFTLLLGRPFDQALLQALLRALLQALLQALPQPLLDQVRAAPATALAVSDGRGIRGFTGDGALAAVAGTIVGHEAEASFAPDGADWTAAAVPVADKLWVVGLAHRSVRAQPLAVVRACGAAGVALLVLGVVLLLRRKQRQPAGGERSADAPADAPMGDGRRSPTGIPARGSPPQLSVVTHLTPSVANAGAGLAVATALAAEGGQQFGRYRLIERIGEGGMAEVFTAVQSGAEGFERLVVIKRLKPHLALNPDAVSQFIDEAKLGSVLAHSNIVTVSDFGKVGEGYYLAAEYVDGRTLAQIAARYLERYGRTIPAAIVFHVIHEVLAGIGYAHDRMDSQGRPLGIVHRDVSPTNIMISFEGEVKLLDFGIVKATERVSKTREGNVKGNVGYMSPEQARGQDVTNRSDLFSLGLVMFELLSGEPFYQGAGAGEILYQAATGPTVDHVARIAKLPPPAPDFLRRVLALDPVARYPNARAFGQDLTPSATMVKGQLAEMLRALFAA